MIYRYKTIDLCAGIGGIRKGFEMTGHFKNVFAAEIDRYACLTYEHLYQENPYNDLTQDDFKEQLSYIDYDVLLAGFPCQAFSSVGEKKGFADPEKGIIFLHIADIIKKTRPRALFLENVENLVRHDKGKTFNIILETLEHNLRYKVIGVTDDFGKGIQTKNFIRNSKFFGIPQNRPRTYIMAFDKKRYGTAISKIKNVLLPEKREGKPIYKNLSNLLELGQADIKYYISAGYFNTLVNHKERQHARGNGFGYAIVNKDKINPVANTIMATGGAGKERNLVFDKRPGFAGKIVAGKRTPINNQGIRFMTAKEWGKLQGFIGYAFINKKTNKEEFSFPKVISESQQYKLFGNSVTIPVIETMAEFMFQCFKMLGDNPEK